MNIGMDVGNLAAMLFEEMRELKKMNTQLTTQPTSKAPAEGFSLVEVVIAVGIMALGITAVLGLLPHGLAMTKKTADLTYQTRIFQQILSEYQAMPWTEIVRGVGNGERRSFDYEGIELRGGQEQLLSYVAEVELENKAVSLPSTTNPPPNDNLRRLIVKIAATPNSNYKFETIGTKKYAAYSALLARTN